MWPPPGLVLGTGRNVGRGGGAGPGWTTPTFPVTGGGAGRSALAAIVVSASAVLASAVGGVAGGGAVAVHGVVTVTTAGGVDAAETATGGCMVAGFEST